MTKRWQLLQCTGRDSCLCIQGYIRGFFFVWFFVCLFCLFVFAHQSRQRGVTRLFHCLTRICSGVLSQQCLVTSERLNVRPCSLNYWTVCRRQKVESQTWTKYRIHVHAGKGSILNINSYEYLKLFVSNEPWAPHELMLEYWQYCRGVNLTGGMSQLGDNSSHYYCVTLPCINISFKCYKCL